MVMIHKKSFGDVPRDEELTIDVNVHLILEHNGEKPSTQNLELSTGPCSCT